MDEYADDRLDTAVKMGCHVNDDSRKMLFKHFCNNLYMGQWELARSSAKHVLPSGDNLAYSEILEDIIKQPFNRRYEVFVYGGNMF